MKRRKGSSDTTPDMASTEQAFFPTCTMFAPPWQDRGLRYGPLTPSGYDRLLTEYSTERFGAVNSASLWDPSEELPRRARVAVIERKDADLFERRIPVLQVEIPQREMQAAALFWMARASFGIIARHMGVTRATVRTWISRTRARLRRG